jgi:lycopene cyclase domain-containing protein
MSGCAMTYFLIQLLFGFLPLALLWMAAPRLVWRHRGSLAVIVLLILMISIPWEMLAVDRIWYYSPRVIVGARILNLPVEEFVFFVLDGLLVGTVALILGRWAHAVK